MSTIAALDARLIRVPLTRPWGPDVTSVGVIETHLRRDDGAEGWGFAWTPQIGAESVLALLRHDIAPAAIGRSAVPGEAWQGMWEHLHEAGGGGVTTIALAGLDLAVWDAEARAAASPVSALLGRARESVRAYGSGVNLHYGIDELVAQTRRWVSRGFDAVKVKVGRPDVAEDLDRLLAVREQIGPDRELMIDANQRWDLERATRSLEVLAAAEPAWIEEPLRADDIAGHTELARRLAGGAGIPIAVGENLHTEHRFAEVLRSGAAQIVQPNIVRVGGITPFRRIAALAADAGAPVHPHLLPELSTQLALTLTTPAAEPWVEDVEDAGFGELGVLRGPSPVEVAGGRARERGHIGLGLRFESPDDDAEDDAEESASRRL